jgi:hypothetical protein
MIDLGKEIAKITKELEQDAKRALEDAGEVAAKRAVTVLKEKAPRNQGRYAKGFRIKRELGPSGAKKFTVHSPHHYRLTHLLEFGHATRSGSRTRAFPHFKPAEEEAIKTYVEELEKKLSQK